MENVDQNSENSSVYQNDESDWQIEIPLSLVRGKTKDADFSEKTDEEWLSIIEMSVFFQGNDPLLWGHYLACVYLDPKTNKFGVFYLDKLGVTHFKHVNLNEKSEYYPAVLNLSDEYKKSNVRKVLACSLLQKYATLGELEVKKITNGVALKFDYDQTHAGDLANACKIVEYCTPKNLGKSLMLHGLMHKKAVYSLMVDVVYENKQETIDANNELVYYLGEQLEQLFDPLTEYSPEQTERVYISPEYSPDQQQEKDEPLIDSICQELLTLQSNFTFSIIGFLQKFLIPLRIDVLNEDIPGLSAAKLNRLFPPTIDEVTRINCIFLDALKSATPYGAVEVLKACSITIPYFYKAYSRHEAATKNFSKDVKLFLQKFKDVIPNRNIYTEIKIETIIKGPQEKLMKIKLILERLWQSKSWSTPESQNEAKRDFDNVMEIIDSFGKMDATTMSAYNTRVFTPSGKILTELAKGWPLELQYKWLKRRIVGVFDVIDIDNNKKRDLIVIFSDYIVILNVVDAEKYYVEAENKPLISDVLMNSLINEVALPPKIPKLQVVSHCYINKILVSTTTENAISFTFMDEKNPQHFVYKLASPKMKASYIEELCTKAAILDKVTAFHLFKSSSSNFNIYFTAHELEAYKDESIKSRFTLFLNHPPDISYVEEHGIDLAFFASLIDGKVILTKMLANGETDEVEISVDELVTVLTKELINNYASRTYSFSSPYFKDLMRANEQLAKQLGHGFNLIDIPKPASIIKNAAQPDSNNGSNAMHKKEKSYGTITTFRSSVSDLKDIQPVNTNAKVTKPPPRKMMGKSEIVKNTPKKAQKRSFLAKLFSVFRKRKPEQQKQRATESDQETEITTSNKYPKTSAKKLVEQKPEERIGSVVHNKNINNQYHTPATENPYAESITPPNSPSIVTAPSSMELENVQSPVPSQKSEPEYHDGAIYKQQELARQSQVFNDDLFGDVIGPPVPPKDRTVTPVIVPQPEKFNEEQNVEVLTNTINEMVEQNNSYSSLEPNTRNVSEVYSLRTSITDIGKKSEIIGEEADMEVNTAVKESIAPIFPKIDKFELPKINFTKSPSFAELFQEMRLVLDDSDETVNWRRLSSEVSLNEKYAINKPKNDNCKTSKPLEVPAEVPEQEEPTLKSKHIPVNFQENIILRPQTSKSPRNSPVFNVIKSSPPKIVSRNDLGKGDASRSINSINDVPSFSPLQNNANTRLVELSFHSQDDVSENPFYTPRTEPVMTFESFEEERQKEPEKEPRQTKDTDKAIEKAVPDEKGQDVETTALSNGKNVHSAPLLDELEFSFFHMSFDDTNNTSTRESTTDTGDIFEKTNIPSQKPSEPIFYKFDNFNKSESSFYSANAAVDDNVADVSNEAIWVSPSKLQIYDITDKSDTFFRSLISPTSKRVGNPGNIFSNLKRNTEVEKTDEPSFLKDSSYNYLGNFVVEKEEEKKSTRLEFK